MSETGSLAIREPGIRQPVAQSLLCLSDLHLLPPLCGSDALTCAICGRSTSCGWAQEPSDVFSSWDTVRGCGFCEWCWALLKDGSTRRLSWIGTEGQLQFYASGELGAVAEWLTAPSLPGVVYLTRRHRAQAWVALGRRISIHPRRIWVATDWAGPVLVDGTDTRYLRLAADLLGRRVRRSSLLSGRPTPNEWAAALRDGWVSELEQAIALAGDPIWEVWVHVARPPADS